MKNTKEVLRKFSHLSHVILNPAIAEGDLVSTILRELWTAAMQDTADPPRHYNFTRHSGLFDDGGV